MTGIDKDTGKRESKNKNPFVMPLLGAFAFVFLLVILIFLGNQLRTIEEELSHYAPETTFGIDITDAQTVHVPIYTYIKTGNGDTHVLESIVSIRNSDPQRSIIITSARFYDGRGKLVKEYLDKSLKLAPLENRTFIVKKRNSLVGDSAANFIITWKSEVPVYEPIIDAVMFGFTQESSFTFKSVGRPLVTRNEQ